MIKIGDAIPDFQSYSAAAEYKSSNNRKIGIRCKNKNFVGRVNRSYKYEKNNIYSNNERINAVRDLWLIPQLGDYRKEQKAKKA